MTNNFGIQIFSLKLSKELNPINLLLHFGPIGHNVGPVLLVIWVVLCCVLFCLERGLVLDRNPQNGHFEMRVCEGPWSECQKQVVASGRLCVTRYMYTIVHRNTKTDTYAAQFSSLMVN